MAYPPLGRRVPFSSLVNCIWKKKFQILWNAIRLSLGGHAFLNFVTSLSFMAQSKLFVTCSYAFNVSAMIPNDPFAALISNVLLRVFASFNPFISRFPVGSRLTAFPPKLLPSPLIVVPECLVPCHFVGGTSHGLDICCSAPAG